jgi:hypothetical protein
LATESEKKEFGLLVTQFKARRDKHSADPMTLKAAHVAAGIPSTFFHMGEHRGN